MLISCCRSQTIGLIMMRRRSSRGRESAPDPSLPFRHGVRMAASEALNGRYSSPASGEGGGGGDPGGGGRGGGPLGRPARLHEADAHKDDADDVEDARHLRL